MKTAINRTLMIGLGEVGIKTIVATRKRISDAFGEEPGIIGYLGVGIEEAPTDGLLGGEYFRIRPASDRLQQRALFIKENSMAIQIILRNIVERISYAGIDNGEKWTFSPDIQINVNLVFSLSDIVGSGICIDLAFLLRAMFENRLIISMHCVTSGLMEPYSKRHAANAYGTIQDLDYLHETIDYNHPFSLRLPSESFLVKTPPMDIFYLVGTGDQGLDELVDELYASLLFHGHLESNFDNLVQCIIDGSMDVEDKKAWINLIRATSFHFSSPYTLEHREEILQGAIVRLKYTISVDYKAYNNWAYLYHSIQIAGHEDDLLVIRQEPQLNNLFNFQDGSRIEYLEAPTPQNDIILLRTSGVYPAFQVVGWESELAYSSFDDLTQFHFDESTFKLMTASNYSLMPGVSITNDKLEIYIKARLLGLITDDTPFDEAYEKRHDLLTQIAQKENEDSDNTDALYDSLRHLSKEEFAKQFTCPEDLFNAIYNFVVTRL